MTGRLASSVLVAALIRKAQAEGGFAAVLATGDQGAGAILVILAERGAGHRLYERILQTDGTYSWSPTPDSASVPDLVARRRRFDPDLWVVELDIPSAERFAAEMNSLD
jgi:hypothetical protein